MAVFLGTCSFEDGAVAMLLTGGVPVTSQGNIDFDKVFDWHASQMCTIVNTVSEGLAVIVVITVIPSGASRPKPYDLSPRLQTCILLCSERFLLLAEPECHSVR